MISDIPAGCFLVAWEFHAEQRVRLGVESAEDGFRLSAFNAKMWVHLLRAGARLTRRALTVRY